MGMFQRSTRSMIGLWLVVLDFKFFDSALRQYYASFRREQASLGTDGVTAIGTTNGSSKTIAPSSTKNSGGSSSPSAAAVRTRASQQVPQGPVPHNIFFTSKENILETKQPLHYYQNVKRTIETYQQAWKGDDHPQEKLQVRFLDDADCIDLIQKAEPRLLPHFLNETKGAYKGDICRVAALFLHGGYYFGTDVEVISPVLLDRNVTFSTAKGAVEFFFNSFVASTAWHPILERSLHRMLAYYEGNGCGGRMRINMGCCTLFDAYHQVSDRERGPHLLLEEHNFGGDADSYPSIKRRGTGRFCNWIVHDPRASVAHFYSRIVGSTHCPS